MTRLHFIKQGHGPVVVLSHALGCSLNMWDDVAAMLQDHFTVLRYDHRGHGLSKVRSSPFDIHDLSDDALKLIQDVFGESVHFVGLSMGGMVAQDMAARHPKWVKSIVIANSASHYDDMAKSMWDARIKNVLASGVSSIAEGAMQRWFTPEFRADILNGGADRVRGLREELESCDAQYYAASCAAVAAIDFRESNSQITCPTLIIAGERDEATPPRMSEIIFQTIAGAQLHSIPAAHLSAVEQPAQFVKLLTSFLKSMPS
jgi:3-oxoadipate enol-lactonase